MKPIVKKRMTAFFIYPISLLSAFSARILCLHILGALFKAWNLTETTLPYAPLWAQRLALISGEIADACFLIFLLLPLIRYAGSGKITKKHFLFVVFGILLSVMTVGAFLLFHSARMPKIRTFPFVGAFVLYAILDLLSVVACAYLSRKAPAKMFEKHSILRAILSVFLQTAYWAVSKGEYSAILIVNACLAGFFLFALYEKTQSVHCEILFLFSFRFFTRFVFGFPDLGGAYPVSEPILTGAMNGVSHSALLTAYLCAACAYILLRKVRAQAIQKGKTHVSA